MTRAGWKRWSSSSGRTATRTQVLADVPTTTPESVALSRALRKRGFGFVGPTTVHALMEATGMVDTHLVDCHRRGTARRQHR